MFKTRKITFSKELLEKRVLPPIYSQVSFRNTLLYDGSDIAKFENGIIVVQDIPDYLDIKTKKECDRQGIREVKTIKGHLVDLKNIDNLADYLNHNFSPKSRSNLRRHKNRIEKCFKISYQVYFGAIEKQEYDKAKECIDEAIEIFRKTFDDDHPHIQTTYIIKEAIYKKLAEK